MSDGGQQPNLPAAAADRVALQHLAARLVAARLDGASLPTYPGSVPATLAAAYAIQDAAIDLWPAALAGWKCGLVQPAHRAAFGGADRIAGPIFHNMMHYAAAEGGADLPVFEGGFAAVEAEFVFRVGADAPPHRSDWSLEDAAGLVDDMFIGVESAGSPFPAINDLGPAVTASDFGNNAGLVVGPPVQGWRTAPPDTLVVATFIDGECVGRGDASLIPGGLMAAVAFIAGNAAARGRPLRRGQFISTGAVTGVHAIHIGQHASADFGRLGTIVCRTVKAEPVSRTPATERLNKL